MRTRWKSSSALGIRNCNKRGVPKEGLGEVLFVICDDNCLHLHIPTTHSEKSTLSFNALGAEFVIFFPSDITKLLKRSQVAFTMAPLFFLFPSEHVLHLFPA